MSDTKLSATQKADKEAIESHFKENFVSHVIADVKMLAPPLISSKIRSEKYVAQWGRELAKLAAISKSHDMNKRLNFLRIEAADLKRQYHSVLEKDTVVLREWLRDEVGFEMSAAEPMQMASLRVTALLLKEIREVSSLLKKREDKT